MTPEQLKQEILEDYLAHVDAMLPDMRSSMRDGIIGSLRILLSTAIDRMAEAVREEERERVKDAYKQGDSDGYERCLKYYFPEDYTPTNSDKQTQV